MNNKVNERYLSNEYHDKNPSWDLEDSPWKASLVKKMIARLEFKPSSFVEVGCGAGAVIAEIAETYPNAKVYGYDIAPAAKKYWENINKNNLHFVLGDFLKLNKDHFQLMLVLDVVEHVPDPINFLTELNNKSDFFIFHFPLDLSALNVARETPLLYVRDKVGHINYFTKGLVLKVLDETNYEIVDMSYSGATFNSPQRTWKTVFASLFRFLFYKINKDFGVRMLGGETLIVLAKVKK